MDLAPTPRMLSEAEQDAQDPFLHRTQPQQDANQPPQKQAEWGHPAWEHTRQHEDLPAGGEYSFPAGLREQTQLSSCPSCLWKCFQRPDTMLQPVLPLS